MKAKNKKYPVPETVQRALRNARCLRLETSSSDAGLSMFNPTATVKFDLDDMAVELTVRLRVSTYEGRLLVAGSYSLVADGTRVQGGDLHHDEIHDWIEFLDHHVATHRAKQNQAVYTRFERLLK